VVHILDRTQVVPGEPPEAFAFFADAFNLEAITPPWLGFRIVTPRPIEMAEGALIEYRLVLHRVPLRWLTRIEVWEPGVRFVDVQIRGPYKLWHHTHAFEAAPGGGTSVRDSVRYSLPLGPLGRLAHAAFVRRDLERIFDFRHEAVARRMGAASDARAPMDAPLTS
jgi:ligand-binding SRPBCC domain-containing protein